MEGIFPTAERREISAATNFAPWIEKYRPNTLQNIVLDKYNRTFFENILAGDKFPHLLFYGPPGTGKTTTIFLLTKHFRGQKHEVLHLNASDDRGIDIIRNQILSFVYSSTFSPTAMKFVVLDEVDNMTKNAQYGLTYLMQTVPMDKVRFCLICNYVNKIIPSLKNEFISVRFNQLPAAEITRFLGEIAEKENIKITKKNIRRLCIRFGSDLRSMINYMQTHAHDAKVEEVAVLEEEVEQLTAATTLEEFSTAAENISRAVNCSLKEILREYFYRLIRTGAADADSIAAMEEIIHTIHTNMDHKANIEYAWRGVRCRSGAPPPN